MGETEVEVGIVGLGTHGTNHADILTQMGHEVFGADTDPESRQEFQSRFDTATYDSPSALFQSGIDAVVISTPNKFHEPAATEAMNAGLDVLLEKPLAHTLESAERIHDVAVETGSICMVGFHHRYRNSCRLVKDYITNSFFGEITHIDAKFIRRRGVPGRGTWYTSNEIAGGGAMMDIGAHLMDLLLFFSGWPEIEDVMATQRSNFGQRSDYAYLHMWGEDEEGKMYDVEDSLTATCKFETGMTANIEVAWAANTDSNHSYVLRGTEAGAHLNIVEPHRERVEGIEENRAQLELFEARKANVDHYVDSDVVVANNDPYADELETFVEAVQSGERPPMTNVDEALQVQRALDTLYEADASQ
jgi:predicted dehydrogenase